MIFFKPRNFFLLSLSIFSAFSLYSQPSSEPQLKVAPIGRIHVDGAFYIPSGNGFRPGAALSEIRAGARASYGNWMTRIEVGYSYGIISMKDVYIQRDLGTSNFLRLGYFIPQFGIRGSGSASYKPAMIPQITESFFRTMSRKIGLGYRRFNQKWFFSSSAFVGGRSLTLTPNEQGKASVGGALRGSWHPITADGNILNIGFSTSYETASNSRVNGEEEEKVSKYRNYSANFPTAVNPVAMLSASVNDAVGDWKFSPELILAKERFALESQFYYMDVARHNSLPAYKALGTYAMVRCLLAGDKKYAYDTKDATVALPSPRSLELVAGYSYVNASDPEALIYGGIANDWNLTCNYYINKYMIARLRYSYTNVRHSSVTDRHGESIIQARLQFVF